MNDDEKRPMNNHISGAIDGTRIVCGELHLWGMEIPKGTVWQAKHETLVGTVLEQLPPPDESLAKVRFSHEVFQVLRKKRIKGETVREAIERIILAAPVTQPTKEKKNEA